MTAPLPTPEACDTCNGSGVYGDDTCPGGCDRGAKVLTPRGLPTPGEVEEMRARHPRRQPADHYGTDDYCGRCGDDWPCDAARLLALVDNQAVTLDEDKGHMDEQAGRLLAVLAALPPHDVILAAQASWGMYAQLYVRLSDRIRRAATGEGM